MPRTGDKDVAYRLQFCVSMFAEMTATKIAEDIGVSVSAVTKWLRYGRITRAHLVDFAYQYSISLVWLLTGLGSMRATTEHEASNNLLPAYALENVLYTAPTVLFTEESKPIHYVHIEGDNILYFAAIASEPGVDLRLAEEHCFVFSHGRAGLEAGRLVVVVKKQGDSKLMLRIAREMPDGSFSFISRSDALPSFTEADVTVVGICVRSESLKPLFL